MEKYFNLVSFSLQRIYVYLFISCVFTLNQVLVNEEFYIALGLLVFLIGIYSYFFKYISHYITNYSKIDYLEFFSIFIQFYNFLQIKFNYFFVEIYLWLLLNKSYLLLSIDNYKKVINSIYTYFQLCDRPYIYIYFSYFFYKFLMNYYVNLISSLVEFCKSYLNYALVDAYQVLLHNFVKYSGTDSELLYELVNSVNVI